VLSIPVVVSLVVVLCDRITKIAAERYLKFYTPYSLYEDYLRLVLWYNDGAAFGLRLGSQWVHIALSLVAMVLVGYLIWHTPRGDRFGLWGFGLIMGGALGNLWDRLIAGHVTDFIDVGIGAYRWPTFNLADGSVVVGICLLVLGHLWFPRTQKNP